MKIPFTSILLLFILGLTPRLSAQIIASSTSGDWNAATTWVGGVVPSATDSVTIAGSHTVAVTANASCGALAIGSGATAATLNINGGSTLTVTKSVLVNRANADNTVNLLNVGAGTLTAASVDLRGNNTLPTRITRLSISTGTVNAVGNTTLAIDGSINATGAGCEVVFTGAGTINISKNFMSGANPGKLTAGTGTISANSSVVMVLGAYTYNNLNVAGTGSVQFIGNTTIGGIFNNTTNNLNTKVRGSLTVTGTFNAGTGLYTFESTTPTTNPVTAQTLMGNISLSKVEIDTNVTLTLPTGFTLTNTGTFNNYGTFVNNGTFTKTAGQYRGNGTFSGATFTNTAVVAPGDSLACLTFANGYDNGMGILDIDLTGATACTQNDQLIVTGTAKASGTVRVDLGSLTPSVGQKFSIISGATTYTGTFDTITVTPNKYVMSYANGELTVTNIVIITTYPFSTTKSGEWTDASVWAGGVVPTVNDSVVIAATHAITVSSAASAKTILIDGGATTTTLTINGTNTLTVNGSVAINRPTADNIANILNVGAGTLTAASIDLKGNNTNPTRITRLSISTGTINAVGNAASAIDGSITATGTPSEVVFTGAGTININKNFMSGANSGTLTAGTGTIAASSSLVMVFGPYTYNNVTVAGTGSVQFIGNTTIGGAFNNTANNLTVRVRGNLTSTGTFNAGTGTYAFESTSPNTNPVTAQTLTGNLSLVKMEIDTSVTLTLATGSILTNAGTFTNYGTFVSTGTFTKTEGAYKGNGTFSGKTYLNKSSIAPGDSLACMTFSSGFDNGTGLLDLDISGTTACTLFDQIAVTGTAKVSGELKVDFGAYTPSVNQTFTIISGATTYTGAFDSITVLPRKIKLAYANGIITVSSITPIQSVIEKSTFSVKSTLVHDVITLVSTDEKPTTLHFYNISGQALLNTKIQGEQNVNVSHLPAGLYFIRTQAGEVGRFVKQ
jgi:hypothetical protein